MTFGNAPDLLLGPKPVEAEGRLVDDQAQRILGSYNVFYQVRHERAASQRLAAFLKEAVHSGELTKETGELARKAWDEVHQRTKGRMSVPDACPGLNGQLLYTWDSGVHHLEIEIFPDGVIELFYRNRASGELWEEEYLEGKPLPNSALPKLLLFA